MTWSHEKPVKAVFSYTKQYASDHKQRALSAWIGQIGECGWWCSVYLNYKSIIFYHVHIESPCCRLLIWALRCNIILWWEGMNSSVDQLPNLLCTKHVIPEFDTSVLPSRGSICFHHSFLIELPWGLNIDIICSFVCHSWTWRNKKPLFIMIQPRITSITSRANCTIQIL